MTKNEMVQLAERITAGTASDEEMMLYNRLLHSFQPSVTETDVPSLKNRDALQAQLKEAIENGIGKAKPATVRMQFFKYAAAAAVIILLGTGSYFLFRDKERINQTASVPPAKPLTEILPGKDGAILTLANGKTIVLEEAGNGKITEQAVKQNNTLSYQNAPVTAVEYNMVSTPVGRQFSLVLADGSKVWLNAASSLRFPTAFTGKERTVELTGEGYFEVAHNEALPFHVKVNEADVEVLGTHFNINNYGDEGMMKTTLVEGKVTVKKASAVVMLSPGQQAQMKPNGAINVEKNTDVEAALAWKNGLFRFDGADMKTIAGQIERWYDVTVQFKGNFQHIHLSGEAPRTLNLSQVAAVLEASGIDVKTDGRNLTVSPKP